MPSHNFDDTLIGREDRESNYRTWSERAVVVGFNAENDSYNVVITTEKTLGDNVRTLNRIVRNVKSVLSTDVKTYFPGDSIIVGYVDDRREHPLIVGLGDSSGHTCIKVTLGIDSNLPVVEGPGAPSLVDPVFTPTPCLSGEFLEDSVTGSTTTLTLECAILDIFGCYRAEVDAPSGCGCGVYEWELSGTLAGVTISDAEISPLFPPQAIGLTISIHFLDESGTSIKICPPISNTSVTGLAYVKQNIFFQGGPGVCANCNTAAQGFRCDDSLFGICNAQTCGNTTPFGCDGINVPDCKRSGSTCTGPPLCPGGFSACTNIANDFGFICDKRLASMISDGCAPCGGIMGKSILTATDACGVSQSLEVEVIP